MAKQDYINVFAYSPSIKMLPYSARGNFIIFLINWIIAGCKPFDVNQLQTLIGMRDDIWNRYKIALKDTCEEIVPQLQAIYKRKEKEREYFNNYHRAQKALKIRNSTFSDSEIPLEQSKRPRTLSHAPEFLARRDIKASNDKLKGEGRLRD